MDELELIKKLTQGLPTNESVVVGPGDDCAVMKSGSADTHLLFKTDAVVEGVHFLPDTEAEKIGHKALARCVSDFAAMAGTPAHAMVTLGLPEGFDAARIEEIYKGMNRLAEKFGIAVVGGETTTNPGGLLISISLLGTVVAGRAVLRSGAQTGDAVFVTGELGGSLAGRHLEFVPRIEESRWLADEFDVHAMIDVSDGLASDLRHILAASGVGAELRSPSVPISKAAKIRAREAGNGMTPLSAALTDGEDFELLFTVKSGDAVRLLDSWKARFPETKLTCVGRITEKPGLLIRDDRGLRSFEDNGYVHFKES